MTNAEHLIENAIMCLEKGNDYDAFVDAKHNREMSRVSGINLDDVWRMAQHVVYTLKPSWLWKKEDEMIEAYGYKLED